MSQNSLRTHWTFNEVEKELKDIMKNIFKESYEAAEKYGHKNNLQIGANIAGFLKVANAMIYEGYV